MQNPSGKNKKNKKITFTFEELTTKKSNPSRKLLHHLTVERIKLSISHAKSIWNTIWHIDVHVSKNAWIFSLKRTLAKPLWSYTTFPYSAIATFYCEHTSTLSRGQWQFKSSFLWWRNFNHLHLWNGWSSNVSQNLWSSIANAQDAILSSNPPLPNDIHIKIRSWDKRV